MFMASLVGGIRAKWKIKGFVTPYVFDYCLFTLLLCWSQDACKNIVKWKQGQNDSVLVLRLLPGSEEFFDIVR